MSDHMVVVVDPQFPALLQELRRERGLSLRQLGALVTYSHTYLWEIETAANSPRCRSLRRLTPRSLLAAGSPGW
jgi:transcriptional regulator with XRE-family HTH domain